MLASVYVTKEARERGVGRKLLADLTGKVRRNPSIQKLHVEVSPMQEAALHLYKHMGFVIVGKEKRRLGDGKEHEDYLMELEL